MFGANLEKQQALVVSPKLEGPTSVHSPSPEWTQEAYKNPGTTMSEALRIRNNM